MKPNELIEGGYYVREERSLILHFYSAGSDGLARYHVYNVHDGKYRQTGSCALGTIMIWTDRKATVEEIGRLQREYLPEVSKQSSGIFERRSRSLREVLRRTKGDGSFH